MHVGNTSRAASILVGAALLLSGTAANSMAGFLEGGAPLVTDTVVQTSESSWRYSFTLTSGLRDGTGFAAGLYGTVSDFFLPYFPDSGIVDIASPDGWTVSFESWDATGVGDGLAGAVHWSTSDPMQYGLRACLADYYGSACLEAAPTLSGFGYTAPFAPVKAPFLVLVTGAGGFLGDPAFPGSPQAAAAGLNVPLPAVPLPVSAVPEPSTYALLLLGLSLLAWRKYRAAA